LISLLLTLVDGCGVAFVEKLSQGLVAQLACIHNVLHLSSEVKGLTVGLDQLEKYRPILGFDVEN
jgi:hypothetical protein